MARLQSIRPESMPIIGAVFSMIFWISDSVIDTYVFNDRNLFIESLLGPDSMELASRLEVIALLMLFSLIAMVLLSHHIEISNQLNRYKNRLELLVDERTRDLISKNKQLEVEIFERRKVEAELEYQASIDPLTSIINRRKFNETLSYELKREERYRNGLSLIICDLDRFKNINDEFGHDGGDQALIAFTRLISNAIRKSDVFARWGGEEFVILLPGTELEEAMKIASKLRLITEASMIPHVGRITTSFGVSEFQQGDSEESLIKRADMALFKAKENGRNRVEVAYQNNSSKNLSLAPH
jgi:diguanylate cyclase (GGDEF)-like protein